MIIHIVLFTPKANLDPLSRRALADAFGAALTSISTIRRARVGRRRTHGRAYEHLMREDYSHAAILEFDDMEGLREYLDHPTHEALAAQFFAAFERALMYDFELDEGTLALEDLVETP
jgi:hypothetical protein